MRGNYHVPKQTKVLESAEFYADKTGEKQGFDRKSPKWKKAYNEYLTEWEESVVPSGEIGMNPKIADSVLDDFTMYFGSDSMIAKSMGLSYDSPEAQEKIRQFRGIITQLTHHYCDVVLDMKIKSKKIGSRKEISDFEFTKDMDPASDDAKNVYLARYTRIMIFTAFLAAVRPIYNTEKSPVMSFIEKDLAPESIAFLKEKKNRQSFVKKMFDKFSSFFPAKTIF